MDTKRNRKRDIKKFEKFLVEFYNRLNPASPVNSVTDIPVDVLIFLSYLEYADLVKPFIAEDLKEGMSKAQICIKYGVGEWTARKIKRDFSLKKRKTRSKPTS